MKKNRWPIDKYRFLCYNDSDTIDSKTIKTEVQNVKTG